MAKSTGRYTQRTIGSKPTPRDSNTEAVRDELPKGNPFGKKYGTSKDDER